MSTGNLCSHLVRRSLPSGGFGAAVLEAISDDGALLGVDDECCAGEPMTIECDGFRALGVVVGVRRREFDSQVEILFPDGREWSARDWAPDHLLRTGGFFRASPDVPRAAAAGVGR